MFTGIVESLGEVVGLDGGVLQVLPATALGPDPVRLGESIAVNGCCLTVVAIEPALRFDLSPETLARTSLGALAPGRHVNLERAMRADGRFGGHIVQGHVDATGEVVSISPAENSTAFRFRVPPGSERYLIDKGSITVDGISLTVVKPEGNEFDAWIIPHTLANTNLGERAAGDRVNLEFDALARYVERLLASGR
ncbi:MAG TPA: riboflavin synthase [Fimbriimonadaceae bacterium]|nr:riboflavin synthase [Fimbriimonadaceae bacterium]